MGLETQTKQQSTKTQTNTANSAEITKYFVNEEIMDLVNNKSALDQRIIA